MRLWLHLCILIGLWGVITILRAEYTVPWGFTWYFGIFAAAVTMIWVGYILGRHDLLAELRRKRTRHDHRN